MKNDEENTQAGRDCQERLVLPLWAEYGEGPSKRGDYNIKVRAKDGREKVIPAWHNPGNGHWLADGKECGYSDTITPPGETEEWRITHWQNTIRLPSVERGCDGKMRMSLSESPHRKAQELAKKHGKDFGVYRCPHCDCYHLTSKLDKKDQYAPLEYQTNFFEPND